jgi:PHP-associated
MCTTGDTSSAKMTVELAARYDLPGGAGSDAHDPEGIGAAYLDMPDFDGQPSFSPHCGRRRLQASTGRTPSAMHGPSPEARPCAARLNGG